MELKKSPKFNLENHKVLSFLIGLAIALSVIYVALEWRSNNGLEKSDRQALDIAELEDAMLVPEQQEPEPPEPEAVPEQKIEVALPEEFKVVDDNKEVAKITLVSTDERKELPPPAPIVQAPPAQEEEEDKIFEIVEEKPIPPGGSNEALLKWIRTELRYPEVAAENGIQGRVYVQFVVERDGSVSDVKVVRGVDPSLDREALRVVSKMGKWTPGKQRGKPVRSRYSVPITFQLAKY